MTDLQKRLIPVGEASSASRLTTDLIFKLLANLRCIGKLDDDELATVAGSLIAELDSDEHRRVIWEMIEGFVPDFKRPDPDKDKQDHEQLED
jgi:hypothetical protein